ncbi:alanine/glycine:cation symporter family protein [Albibacterium indicum]|uniref:alanine/glycine:cation symporter family protein n=1 Tax=Albibacterium indicum TaxID=2292082 RepID=UPI000E4CC1B9|nr:alanine:cation symporter family protein [Pedobacter indicus]
MDEIISIVNGIVWSNALVILCLGAGIYFSFTTKFLQIRYLREMIRLLFSGKSSTKGVSSFQAFAIAISGRVGTGNIAGVAIAIAMGGPGAIFWMWVIAFLGSASAFIEATLGQLYKQVNNGQYRGGPAFYIEKGLGIKWYSMLFALVTIVSTAVFLPGVQSNSIALSMQNAFDIPVAYTGVAIVLFLALIIFGPEWPRQEGIFGISCRLTRNKCRLLKSSSPLKYLKDVVSSASFAARLLIQSTSSINRPF